jgi:uncharacterized membrane protein YraQ (UPF0718 family)
MAIIRPIAAVSSAIVAGLLVGKEKGSEIKHLDKDIQTDESDNSISVSKSCCAPKLADVENGTEKQTSCSSKKAEIATKPKASCCSISSDEVTLKKEVATEPKTACCATSSEPVIVNSSEAVLEKNTSCCDTEHPAQPMNNGSSCCDSKKDEQQAASFFSKLKQAVYFSCNKLLSDTMGWLMIGLFFAALVQTYVPTSFLSQWGDGILAMVVVILVSIPMYICATASTPIAAGLLMAGVSPGAVLVFMLAGPATNIATLGVVATELGKRAVSAYLTGVIGVAIAFGFLTDYLVEQLGFEVNPAHAMEHELMPNWLTQGFGVILLILMLRLVLISLKQRMK